MCIRDRLMPVRHKFELIVSIEKLDVFLELIFTTLDLRVMAVKPHFKHMLYISIVFMLYQAVGNTAVGILSEFTHQNGNDWVGPFAGSIVFIGCGIAAVKTSYINRYSIKTILFVCSFAYAFYIAMIILFLKTGFGVGVEIVILIVSFLAGVLSAGLYNAYFNYINICSELDQ